jgi:hypothetical protein
VIIVNASVAGQVIKVQGRRRRPRSDLVSAPDAPAITGGGRRPYRRRANTRRSG